MSSAGREGVAEPETPSTGRLAWTLAPAQARFSLTPTSLALLVALLAATSSVSQPILGVVADRVGARQTAALGVLTAAALLAVAVSTSLVIVGVAIVVGGLGAAAFHPAATTLVRGVSGHRPDVAVGLFSAGGMLGLAVGPLVIVALLGAGHRNLVPYLVVPALLGAWWVHRLPPATARAMAAPPARSVRPAWTSLMGGPVAGLALAATLSHVAWTTYISTTPQIIATRQARPLPPRSAGHWRCSTSPPPLVASWRDWRWSAPARSW